MKYFTIVAIIIVTIASLVSCSQSTGMWKGTWEINLTKGAYEIIPANAILLKDHGNGWIEFELDGNRYLFRHLKSGVRGYDALTQITE